MRVSAGVASLSGSFATDLPIVPGLRRELITQSPGQVPASEPIAIAIIESGEAEPTRVHELTADPRRILTIGSEVLTAVIDRNKRGVTSRVKERTTGTGVVLRTIASNKIMPDAVRREGLQEQFVVYREGRPGSEAEASDGVFDIVY